MSSDPLRELAERCLSEGPYSVTHKPQSDHSKDPHDYVSGRLYWWNENGEYVRRDGQPNPIYRSERFDRSRLGHMIDSVITLSIASREYACPRYAEAAVNLLNTWFLDQETRMNPHLRYAQVLPGTRSNGCGIIDTYGFYFLLEQVEWLIEEGHIDSVMERGLRDWFHRLANWMMHSYQGRKERRRANNHGTSFDVQLLRYQLFSKMKIRAKLQLLRSLPKRLVAQIDERGRQPHESKRATSLHYHWYNLNMLVHLCELGRVMGKDMFSYQGRLESAFAFLEPYLCSPEDWPGEQINTINPEILLGVATAGAVEFQMEQCATFMRAHSHLLLSPSFIAIYGTEQFARRERVRMDSPPPPNS